MKSPWDKYGFTERETDMLMSMDIESGSDTEELYIEAERCRFYDEFYSYMREEDDDLFFI